MLLKNIGVILIIISADKIMKRSITMYRTFDDFINKNLYYNTNGLIDYLLIEGGGPLTYADVDNLYYDTKYEIYLLQNDIKDLEKQMASPVCSNDELDRCEKLITDNWNKIDNLEKIDGTMKNVRSWISCSNLMGQILYTIGEPVIGFGNIAYWGCCEDEPLLQTEAFSKMKNYLYTKGYIDTLADSTL